MAVWGVILAGGLARRMGGGDKGMLAIAGRPVLAHVIARLRPQVAGLLLNANNDPARFAPFGLPVIPDGVPDHPGPLAGVLAGLDWVAAHAPDCDGIVSVPGDTPFLPEDLVARLSQAGGFACAASAGRRHPVAALWPLAARMALRQALAEGMRRVGGFATSQVDWPAEPVDPFFNVNTPEDLAAAARLATGPP